MWRQRTPLWNIQTKLWQHIWLNTLELSSTKIWISFRTMAESVTGLLIPWVNALSLCIKQANSILFVLAVSLGFLYMGWNISHKNESCIYVDTWKKTSNPDCNLLSEQGYVNSKLLFPTYLIRSVPKEWLLKWLFLYFWKRGKNVH